MPQAASGNDGPYGVALLRVAMELKTSDQSLAQVLPRVLGRMGLDAKSLETRLAKDSRALDAILEGKRAR